MCREIRKSAWLIGDNATNQFFLQFGRGDTRARHSVCGGKGDENANAGKDEKNQQRLAKTWWSSAPDSPSKIGSHQLRWIQSIDCSGPM
jgi:hypothetical protein